MGANRTKLYAMGLRQAVRLSTPADASERSDYRMWADFAFVLIRRANELYADEPLGLNFARRCQMHQAGAFLSPAQTPTPPLSECTRPS